jgi:hypothetical protein
MRGRLSARDNKFWLAARFFVQLKFGHVTLRMMSVDGTFQT